MLETPPVLTIRRHIERPTAKKVANLAGALSGNSAGRMRYLE